MQTSTETKTSVIEVGDSNFEKSILKATLPMIVDFTADWCPPYRALSPVYRQLSTEYSGRLGFARLDIDENQETAFRYGIQGAPTLIIVHNGKEIERIVGPHPGRLRSLIDRALSNRNL